MKVRSAGELSQRLAEELGWRKKELTALKFIIEKETRPHNRKALLRASVPILYAHWEGFTKLAGTLYVELVSRQKLKYSELAPNFLAIACKKALNDAASAKFAVIANQVVEFFLYNMEDQATLPRKDVVDTEANLSSTVLKNIFCTIGLTYVAQFSTRELFIDGVLLDNRNRIAHGERTELDFESYQEMHTTVIELLSSAKELIENAAALQVYRRVP
jgi:MAE_28990/MAE_18760-like HEPN